MFIYFALLKVFTLTGIQWARLFNLIRKRVSESESAIVKRKDFTCHFGDLHAFITSKEIEVEFSKLLNIHVSSLTEHHFHALMEVMMSLNRYILQTIADNRSHSATAATQINVREMENEGKRKVRYCGAWAIAKERKSCQNYFSANLYSTDQNVCC